MRLFTLDGEWRHRVAKAVAGRTLAGMAWRIDEAVVRGEIDNRVRGRVTGRIWLVDRDEPVELDLAGNAWRDLAGRRLEFTNPEPKPRDLKGLGVRQTGMIGDCTASRKVKVPEVSMDELMELYKQRKPFPWHWGNSLYLEWFGTGNDRVPEQGAGAARVEIMAGLVMHDDRLTGDRLADHDGRPDLHKLHSTHSTRTFGRGKLAPFRPCFKRGAASARSGSDAFGQAPKSISFVIGERMTAIRRRVSGQLT